MSLSFSVRTPLATAAAAEPVRDVHRRAGIGSGVAARCAMSDSSSDMDEPGLNVIESDWLNVAERLRFPGGASELLCNGLHINPGEYIITSHNTYCIML